MESSDYQMIVLATVKSPPTAGRPLKRARTVGVAEDEHEEGSEGLYSSFPDLDASFNLPDIGEHSFDLLLCSHR